MRRLVVGGVLGLVLGVGAGAARADVSYDLVAYTTDSLVRGTVELEERVSVSVQGDRLRQEARGARTVVTRRGARYQKPGHRLTLEQPDRGVRYDGGGPSFARGGATEDRADRDAEAQR